jgi:hypothetical protein
VAPAAAQPIRAIPVPSSPARGPSRRKLPG